MLFSNLSTVISHNAAYSTLRDLRERVVEKLAKVPMGTILDTPSGHYKSIIVDRIEGMEVPFAHLLPEMTSNMLVPLFIIVYLFVLDWRMALLSLATLFIGLVIMSIGMRNYATEGAGAMVASKKMADAVVEYIGGIEVVKAFSQSAGSYEKYRNNTGLLLFGDVGTGKSFFAGCIANALLDRDVPVLMTNFPTILNRLTGMFSEDRADFIASFDEYDLLIIDDLGVERSTEYAMEQMFFVIDSRYRSRRPMIITTNLKLAELKNPPDLAHARIYDRILERCAPILFAGKNFREENAGATKQAAKDIVNRKHE